MTECVDCELRPVGAFNGQSFCLHHLEQEIDFASRAVAPIAYTRHVEMHPVKGASTSGTPRHYK